jgi:predicted acetyltransferase
MPADIRIPSNDDRDDLARLLSTSLNFPLAGAMARKDTFILEDMRCAYVEGRPVANAAEFRFTQWFGGRGLATSGIWGVVTEPEHRGEGLASACLGELLDHARRRGDALTSLFPAVLDPYRKMGYELAGTFDEHRIALDDLPTPRTDDLRVELADVDRDLDAVRTTYRGWASDRNGVIEPNEIEFWRDRLLVRPWNETARAVVVRDRHEVVGFAAFTRTPDPSGHLGDIGFGLNCSLLFTTDGRARDALVAYARDHRGVGRWMQWGGPPNDPLTLLVGVQALTAVRRYRWMLRILDVPTAFEGRGYPPIEMDVTFGVDDPRYPQNAGPWHVVVSGGEAKMEPVERHARMPIPIAALSSLYTGYLRPADAVVLGVLDAADPAVDAFSAMFDGPDPWTPFFF